MPAITACDSIKKPSGVVLLAALEVPKKAHPLEVRLTS
jgi:hypothetical protein